MDFEIVCWHYALLSARLRSNLKIANSNIQHSCDLFVWKSGMCYERRMPMTKKKWTRILKSRARWKSSVSMASISFILRIFILWIFFFLCHICHCEPPIETAYKKNFSYYRIILPATNHKNMAILILLSDFSFLVYNCSHLGLVLYFVQS